MLPFNTRRLSASLPSPDFGCRMFPFAGPRKVKSTNLFLVHWMTRLAAIMTIRRQGHDVAEAQDLTQEFFASLLERDYLARFDQERGKFRSFLLAFVKHFLSEQREKAGAQKRGGGRALLSLDAAEGEEGYVSEPVDELTPEQIFERRWVQTLLQRAFDRLAAEYVKVDKAALFEALKDFQPRQSGSLTYAQIGDGLGTTEAAIKSAMQRLRQRHREILRKVIAQTVTSAKEVEEEIRHMREVLNR